MSANALITASGPTPRPKPLSRRRLVDRVFVGIALLAATSALIVLGILLSQVVRDGWSHFSAAFISSPPSRHAAEAGFLPAMMGSVWICVICAITAIPIGIGTAVLLEEFLSQTRHPLLSRAATFINLNITNLAGVPSIVYGIIGLTVFSDFFGLFGTSNDPFLEIGERYNDWFYLRLPFGRGPLAGGLTLMLVTLPIIIAASQEALRAVPNSLREAALGLGATRIQMVLRTTLPAATPGLMTASILAMSRAIGEAAPILMIAGVVSIRFAPTNLMDDFTAMPLQIYNWVSLPQEEFHQVAASGIMVLLIILFALNALAVVIRQVSQKPL